MNNNNSTSPFAVIWIFIWIFLVLLFFLSA